MTLPFEINSLTGTNVRRDYPMYPFMTRQNIQTPTNSYILNKTTPSPRSHTSISRADTSFYAQRCIGSGNT